MFSIDGIDPNKAFAITDKGLIASYSDWFNIQSELAIHVNQRSLVLVLTKNSLGSVAGLFGLINIKAVVLPVDAGISAIELESLLAAYEPEFLFVPSETCVGSEVGQDICLEVYDYSLYKLPQSTHALVDDDLALLLTTSGSTGTHKFVRLSYVNIESNAASIVEYLGINSSDRPITTLPLHYSFGFSIISSHLLAGATLLISEASIVTREFWDFASDNRATTFGGVPFTFQTIKKMRLTNLMPKSLRYVTQAGGSISEEISSWAGNWSDELGIDFIVMYGQTEASPRMSYVPASQFMLKSGSIGIPVPGGRFEIRDEANGLVTNPGQIGEIWYYGQNVSQGYAESRSDLNLGDKNSGLLKTGDLGHFDADGFYFIDGRISRFIKLHGNRISLDELELAFSKEFSECAVLATDSELNLFISVAEHDERKIIEVAGRLRIHPTSFTIHKVQEIPRSVSGKIDYSFLRKKIDIGS
jgi:acyl-CoA synthetase (AMP-forming)/AMP-acid ligase II